jgi:hypothetical protein
VNHRFGTSLDVKGSLVNIQTERLKQVKWDGEVEEPMV